MNFAADIFFAAHRAAGVCVSASPPVWCRNFKPWQAAAANRTIFSACCWATAAACLPTASYVKADAYYHSGYYPTIFDNRDAFQTPHMAEDTGAVDSHNQGEEEGFLGPPRDWIDAFGRHFIPNRHTHLDEGGPTDDLSSSNEVREILPWLKLSADLDPDNVQTYTSPLSGCACGCTRSPRPTPFARRPAPKSRQLRHPVRTGTTLFRKLP